MRMDLSLGIACALAVQVGVVLFGGAPFTSHKTNHGTLQSVELLSEMEDGAVHKPEEEKQKEEEKAEEEDSEKMEAETEQAPDASEMVREMEASAAAGATALEAASLGAIEAALSGQSGGGGDMSSVLTFSSGGRIGGMAKAGSLEDKMDNAFSLAEIDQKPRPVFQAAPVYPNELRGRKVEGLVTVLFTVDPSGKVSSLRVEKSSHPAFEKPALAAVKQWKFEPAVKAGERVSCKMRVPIRFQPG